MSEVIKYIASFSGDAVHNAIEQAVGGEKEKLIDMLKTVQSVLEKPQGKLKKESKIVRISDKTIYGQKIRPQIAEKLAEYDRLETAGECVELNVRLEFLGDYMQLDIKELKKRHAMILEEEKSLTCLDLVVKYYRGLVYFRARQLRQGDENIKTMFRREFGVCYNTAMRFITFAALMKRYPRLMICGLSYVQITKHQKRLLDYLKTDASLHDKLSQPLSVSAQNKALEIQPVDIGVLKAAYNTDPDYVFDDFYYNPDCDATPEDEEQARWLNESGEILDESLLDDDVELLGELENVCIT
jgi:hypothetical protein